jgi:hypothetical protein
VAVPGVQSLKRFIINSQSKMSGTVGIQSRFALIEVEYKTAMQLA